MGRDFAKFRAVRKVGAFPSLKPARLRLLPPATSVAAIGAALEENGGQAPHFP